MGGSSCVHWEALNADTSIGGEEHEPRNDSPLLTHARDLVLELHDGCSKK